MTNEFSSWYLALLRKQVEEELQFLKTNNHHEGKNYLPCMFCVDTYKGHYNCNRVSELTRFLSSIVSHGRTSALKPQERKKIGFEMPDSQDQGTFKIDFNVSNLPLLSTKL